MSVRLGETRRDAILQKLGMQNHETALRLLGQPLFDHRMNLAADLLAAASDARREILLLRRRRNDRLAFDAVARARQSQQFGIKPVTQIEHRALE